jgi:metallo-beta-lactamase class B
MIKQLALLFLPLYLLGQSHPSVELSKIEDSVWVHTSWRLVGQYDVPSNGLIVSTSAGLLLIDTPWDDTLTAKLLETTRQRFKQPVVLAVITHAHDDRIGGIRTLRKMGIKVVSLPLTCQKAKELGYPEPDLLQSADTTFVVGDEELEMYYPGAGHTKDNLVVWLPRHEILFGGCLVKSESSTNIGNIADADLQEWPLSIQRVMDKFRMARTVIPGHGECGGFSLLQHTLSLLQAK